MQRLAAYGEPVEGTPFGRYRLIELLGRGGMGEVWRAHDTVIDRIVAVKVLPAHLADDKAFVQRFRREAHAAARLNNPHVVPIHNSGEIDGRLYVDMRLIEGRDLQEVLADGPLEPARAVRIIEQAAKALHAAHKIGLVHRDVKPSNILLDEDDFAYLIDFGIARGADQTRMTSTGGVIGSFHYMAPERFSAQGADARADVYALACVLYECLTGRTPYPGDSLEQQYDGHKHTPPPQPSSTNPDLPAQFDPVIATGMAKDPDQRYATTVELAKAARDAITTPLASPSEPTLRGDAPPATPTPAPTLLADSTLAAAPPPQQRRKPAKTRQVIERDKLGALSKIGQGGQGVVYRAPNVKTAFAASMVYKEYKTQARPDVDFTALAAMPALVEESLTYAQAERLISIAAWPCAIVDDAGTPTGFVMPAIPDEFFIPLTTAKGVSPSTAEFQHLLNHPTVLAARGIEIDDAQRYTLLRETASALAFLHKHGVCVGDISPKNLLFSLTPHEAVYFIDCDAMRINTVSALPQVETPGWNAPPGEELATSHTDTYKLGLLALRLLSGDHDTTNPQHLPSTTPAQLRQIITDTLTNQPHQRPLPEAWTHVLGNAIEHAQHQQKTTPPVSATPAPPPTPVVRSRPPAHSKPLVRQSAPPVPPPRPAPAPAPQIQTPPPPPGHRPSRRLKWPLIALGIILLVAAFLFNISALLTVGLVALVIGMVLMAMGRMGRAVGGQRPRRRLKWPLIAAIVVVLAASAGITGYLLWPKRGQTLPFTGLNRPYGVAVDAAGSVYVTEENNNRVVKLAAGSTTQSVLPFTGLNHPRGVAVDAVGDMYVVDNGNNRVVELAAGSTTESVLPFTGLNEPIDVVVDTAGNLYVTDENNDRVLKLAPGSSIPTVLPFSGLGPWGVAVDTAGNLYVTDSNKNRVLELAPGSTSQSVLPFNSLNQPRGVAVDAAGDLYVVDGLNNRVLKLVAGSSTQSVLGREYFLWLPPLGKWFTGLTSPCGVAVDSAGNLYVTDTPNNRVLKLPAG